VLLSPATDDSSSSSSRQRRRKLWQLLLCMARELEGATEKQMCPFKGYKKGF